MAAYTETTRRNVFQRLGDSLKNLVIGLVLLVLAFPLLWWNEGQAVDRYKALDEGVGAVVSISSDAVDPAREGALIHLSGIAGTDEILRDPVFGVSVNALALRRRAEMFQWTETSRTQTKKNLGGAKTTKKEYSYGKEWVGRHVDSASFHDPQAPRNPETMAYGDGSWTADDVRIGAFRLSESMTAKVQGREPVAVDDAIVQHLRTVLPETVHGHDGGLFLGRDPASPEVGDMRIRFRRVPSSEVSVIARQAGDQIATYQTRHGPLEMLRMGAVTAESMFETAVGENRVKTWLIRGGGFLLMAIGLGTLLAPLAVLGDVVPFVGSMMRLGISVVAGGLALVLSLATVAVAWLAYRPVWGGILLGGALVVVVGLRRMARGKDAGGMTAPPPPPPPPPPTGSAG